MSPQSIAESSWFSRRWRFAAVLLGLIGVGILFYRGPLASLGASGSADFALVYTSARVWLLGGDPYNMEAVSAEWDRSIPTTIFHVSTRGPVLLYPAAAFVVLAPLAALPFKIASVVWTLLNLSLVAFSTWAVARIAGLRSHSLWLLVVGALWLAPFATNIRYGQTAILVMGFICGGLLARERGGPVIGGALLGLAAVVKPQLGLLFVVYQAGRLRWRVVLAAAAAGAGLFGVGIARMELAGAPWWSSWREQLYLFPRIADGDPTAANPVRHQILNLHYPLHNFTDDRELVAVLVYAIVGVLSLAYFLIDLRRGREKGEGRGEVLSLSMVACITLLVVYHRFYDAVVLLLPLALGIRLLRERGQSLSVRLLAAAVLILLLPFAAPFTALLLKLMNDGRVPPALAEHPVWTTLVMPHETWALVGMAVCLIALRAAIPAEREAGPALTQRST